MRKGMKKIAAVTAAAAFALAMGLPVSITSYAAGTEKVTRFVFTDSGITVTEGDYLNYEIKNNTDLKITGEGKYVVTGSCTDGSVTVKKNVTGVELTLSDLTLSSSSTAPIAVAKYGEADIIIDGAVQLSDGIRNSEDYLENELGMTEAEIDASGAEDAVMKFKDASDVTIKGDGMLTITAVAKNGIKSGSALDANGIDVSPYTAGADTASLTIQGISLNIDATMVYDPNDGDTHGDAIHSECYLYLESGDYEIACGDDAIHCDYDLNIGTRNGGGSPEINISECTEGIEGATIDIYSGDIDINAADDCINAANSDLSNFQYAINVYGGDIYAVSANDGDALDSNGTITISGGKVMAFGGPMGNAYDTGTDGNNSIASTFTISGGTVLGTGIAAMAATPAAGSQGYAIWSGSSNMGPGGNGMFPGRQWNSENGGFSGMTPPDGTNDGFSGMTPPEGTNGGFSGMTPPDGTNGGFSGRPRPDMGNGNGMTPPDGTNGGFPGGNGMFPGGGGTGTVTNLTLVAGSNSYSAGESVSIAQGDSVSIKEGDSTLISFTAPRAAAYVIFSTDGLDTTDSGSGNDQPTPPDSGSGNDQPTPPDSGSGNDQPAPTDRGAKALRLFDPSSGQHLYTTDSNERDYLVANRGWKDEGESFNILKSGGRPVYRFTNRLNGEHFWTASESEYRYHLNNSKGILDYEGIAWYDDPAENNVVRLEMNGFHLYTSDRKEIDYQMQHGWINEGVQF